MKLNIFIITIVTLVLITKAKAQSTIDSVLAEVLRNNKTIQADRQYWESQKLMFKTGLTPSDPTVRYEYMRGNPTNTGNQTDITISQGFDFPTVYGKKNQLANQQIVQADLKVAAMRQNILFNTKIICVELVYRNKLHNQLTERKQNSEKLLDDFQIRLKNGSGNILDVNKARLQLVETEKEFLQNASSISQLHEKLTDLNGGERLNFTDTVYFIPEDIVSFELIENEYEQNSFLRKILEEEKNIAAKQLEVSKAQWLPKFELGYRYQGLWGQTFNGIHAGVTIPLWENKNTVKSRKAAVLFTDLKLQEHSNEHYYEIKAMHEKYIQLKKMLTEYETLFKSLNNIGLLGKALNLGEISTIEYFMETAYYYNSYKNYLSIERDYYDVITELYKYRL